MNYPTKMPGQFRTVACSTFSAVQFTLRKRGMNFRILKNSTGGIGRIRSKWVTQGQNNLQHNFAAMQQQR